MTIEKEEEEEETKQKATLSFSIQFLGCVFSFTNHSREAKAAWATNETTKKEIASKQNKEATSYEKSIFMLRQQHRSKRSYVTKERERETHISLLNL